MSKLRKITAIILALLMISSVCAFTLNANAEETVKINEYDYVVYKTPKKEYAGLLGYYAYGYAKGNADDGCVYI